MFVRVFKYLALFVLVLACSFALWYHQPWSEYSPYKISQMRKPENLMQTFRSMDKAFPYRTIKKSSAPSDIPKKPMLLSFSYLWDGKRKELAQYLKESATTGLIILHKGTIRHEKYFHKADRATQFTSWSVAKGFVATAIFMALKEGKIKSLDDRIEKYVPNFTGTGFGQSTIRNLLTMSAGVNFIENRADPNNDAAPYGFKVFVMGFNPDNLLIPYKITRKPGQEFNYSGSSSQMLTLLLRTIYKKPLTSIMEEKIWQPLGMEGDAYWSQNTVGEKGVAIGYCCMNARLRDYARLGQFYLDAYNNTGKAAELFPEGIVKLLQTPPSKHHVPGPDKYQGRGYSYHFWLPTDPDGEFFASGLSGQYIWIDPRRDIVIAKNSVDHGWKGRMQETMAVMKHIAATVSGIE